MTRDADPPPPPQAFEPNLQNCDREPIHVPGSIQPHGVLLAFDTAGCLAAWSANASALLGDTPVTGSHCSELVLPVEVRDAVLQQLARPAVDDDPAPQSIDSTIGEKSFDVVLHRQGEHTIVEFEHRDQAAGDTAAFALKAHRSIDQLRRQRSVEGLMHHAVAALRGITGFDRVMGYRFRHDDSGDVIAEDCAADLEPYLGRRYPASDIPAQARRLYVLNTLRLIANVDDRPVPLQGGPAAPLLDMSHCVLRSVSPIHIEYLQNIGVAASMSVSIVVGGRLWGLIACHHRSPHRVPYAIRMACDVLAQVLAATLQSLSEQARAVLADSTVSLRGRLLEALSNDDDLARTLLEQQATLCEVMQAEAVLVTEYGRSQGGLAGDLSEAIVASLPEAGDDLLHRHRRDMWPAAVRERIGPWVGLLALRLDPPGGGWLLLLRPEQLHTVRWGGRPEKQLRVGPHGPRLTPRGSFAEWREEVRDTAEPWDDARLALARVLIGEVHRASDRRRSELERARMQMLAMLGHDLRDPLQSITLAAQVMEHRPDGRTLGRIRASSNRMSRLISQVLDMSRLESGAGLQLARRPMNLRALLDDLVDEAQTAYPATRYELSGPATLATDIDADRIGQVISNLLSNARHHGDPQAPIRLRLEQRLDRLCIEVANGAAPIPPAMVAQLFSPFKRRPDNERNRSGLGLGLYISQRIVASHGGELRYRYEAPDVVFTIELPGGGAVDSRTTRDESTS